MRPYCFIVVLWGEKYRQHFTDWCLPSFLAPNNIPALPDGDHVFIVVCPDEDWLAIKQTPAYVQLKQYVLPLHLTFTPDLNMTACKAMGRGHVLATEVAFAMKARGIQLTPDMMISDGLLKTVVRHVEQGTEVLMILALRHAEDAMRTALAKRHYQIGQVPLAVPPRELVAIAMESIHPETQSFEWGHPAFSRFPSACWQRAESGWVCCCLSWLPILFDYGALVTHDNHTLKTWTMDGDYIYRNFHNRTTVQHVTDSDDGLAVGWTPTTVAPLPSPENFNKLDAGSFAKWYNSKAFDPFKRQRFWEPVIWHAGELTPAYQEKADSLRDEFGALLRYDWRKKYYYDKFGKPSGTLEETYDQYNERIRRGT